MENLSPRRGDRVRYRMRIREVYGLTNDADGTIPINCDDPILWKRIHNELSIGISVTGTVICRRPFGVFLDIGYGTGACALVLVPDFKDARVRRIQFDDFPLVGDAVAAWVINIDFKNRKIALSQHTQQSITDKQVVNT
jgi:transcriptional accessory protein Tex/SPT6